MYDGLQFFKSKTAAEVHAKRFCGICGELFPQENQLKHDYIFLGLTYVCMRKKTSGMFICG